jgi:hypothetical protein
MRFLIVPALTLTMVATAGYALASSDDTKIDSSRDPSLTTEQIATNFTSEGCEARRVKEEDGGDELCAIDEDGAGEAFVHPATGDLREAETAEDE